VKTEKEVGKLRGDIVASRKVLTPYSFRKLLSSTPRRKPFRQEMHVKIPLLTWGLKLSDSKRGRRVSALHFFVK
jgi:hypothetical protein